MFSCSEKKEVKLAEASTTVVKEMEDYSSVYIFFETKGKDTIANVNRNNSISSTNWIFHIDKRLPLRLVFPEIIKLQTKKETSLHKSEDSKNFFSYSNIAKKELAFLPFTEVKYHLEKPKLGEIIYFDTNNVVWVNDEKMNSSDLEKYLQNLPENKSRKFTICFSKKLHFEDYIKAKVLLVTIDFFNNKKAQQFSRVTNEEYIY